MRILKGAALVLSAAFCAAVFAGCTRRDASSVASPAPSPSPAASASPAPTATPEDSTPEAAAGYTAAGLQTALEGCLAYGAGSAGTSLKAAIAASGLVRYTAQYGKGHTQEIRDDAGAWYDAMDQDKKDQLQENWPGIFDTAKAITDDPEQAKGLLESAGVMTDFTGVDLETAAACMAELDAVFRPDAAA